MALIVEDGSGLSNSEAYASVAEADAYFTARNNEAWDLLEDPDKEIALRKAADFMTQQYRSRWQGYKRTREQAMDWPRYEVIVDGYEIPSDTIPKELKLASFELAVRASTAELLPDEPTASIVKRQKAGPLEIEYQDGTDTNPQESYTVVDKILQPLLAYGGGSTVPLHRV